MEVVEDQLPAIRHREALDRVAPVQIHQLHHSLLDGQLPPHRRGDGKPGESGLPGTVGAVGLQRRPEEVRTVVILSEGAPVPISHSVRRQRQLVNVVTAGAVHIHLLEKKEVRLQRLDSRHGSAYVLVDRLLRPGTGFGPAVHEEAVIVAVSAEADVVGGNPVGLAGREGLSSLCRRDLQLLPVLYPVPGGKYIDHIGRQHQRQDQHRRQQDLHPSSCHVHCPLFTIPRETAFRVKVLSALRVFDTFLTRKVCRPNLWTLSSSRTGPGRCGGCSRREPGRAGAYGTPSGAFLPRIWGSPPHRPSPAR